MTVMYVIHRSIMPDKSDSSRISAETARFRGLHRRVNNTHKVAFVNAVRVAIRASFALAGVTPSTGRHEYGC